MDSVWINHTSQGDGLGSSICWTLEGGSEYCVDVPDDVSSISFTPVFVLLFSLCPSLLFPLVIFLCISLPPSLSCVCEEIITGLRERKEGKPHQTNTWTEVFATGLRR